MKQGLSRMRWLIYVAALGAGFLAPWQSAGYNGPRTLWVWLGVWQSTMGMSSTTGIVLVTWLAVALSGLGAWLRVWAAANDGRRLLAAGSLLLALAVSVLMPPVGALAVLPVLVAYEVVVIASTKDSGITPRQWTSALLREVAALGVFVSFAALSWQYNAQLLERALLIACGLGLVARAALPMGATKADKLAA